MIHVEHLIVGAGASGLAFANFIDSDDYLVLEREAEVGGWCKTITQDGFVWDYSGHFFHFRHPELEQWLRARIPQGQQLVTVARQARIQYGDRLIDFPFQKNIHQLPHEDFLDCLHDLHWREEAAAQATPGSFKAMLYEKFGRGISERFLIPYNEKLYACDLDQLDREAMGRFFPHADVRDIVRNMRHPDNGAYNATFTYPLGGAIQYIHALMAELDPAKVCTGEGLARVDLRRRVATTSAGRTIKYEHLTSCAPFDKLLAMTTLEHDPSVFTSNKVLVFNLGFDRKGPEGLHWIYYPDPDTCFYRVGFYDNIMGDARMSLYVELGYPSDADIDTPATLEAVMADLKRVGLVQEHALVSHHSVVLDPAYVHITQRSRDEFARLNALLKLGGVHSIGRYGGWTYCSIEDNLVEARALAAQLNQLG